MKRFILAPEVLARLVDVSGVCGRTCRRAYRGDGVRQLALCRIVEAARALNLPPPPNAELVDGLELIERVAESPMNGGRPIAGRVREVTF